MKSSVLWLLIAAGAFGASTIYLAVQLEEERGQAERFAEQSRALHARIAELERAQAELATARLSDADAPSPGVPAPGGKIQLTETREARPEPSVPGPDIAGRGPFQPPPERSEAMRNMMRTQMRANFKRAHADIGEKLGLSQADASKLVDLMIEQQMAMVDNRRQGRDATPEQRAADFEAARAKNDGEISALIGADKMDEYRAYQDTMPARQEVDMLSRQLEGRDASALNADQRSRLVTALAEERSRVPAPKMSEATSREEYLKAMSAWQDDYNQRAATRASSILNADQQNAYGEYQQWTKEMRTQFESRRAAREAPRPDGG